MGDNIKQLDSIINEALGLDIEDDLKKKIFHMLERACMTTNSITSLGYMNMIYKPGSKEGQEMLKKLQEKIFLMGDYSLDLGEVSKEKSKPEEY